MTFTLLATALVMQAAPMQAPQAPPLIDPTVPAEPVELTLPQQTSMRCSAAFAVVVRERNAKRKTYPDYPDLDTRGKEFFVQSLAQVMDETGMGRDTVTKLVMDNVEYLSEPAALDDIMPGCLLLLDASGI